MSARPTIPPEAIRYRSARAGEENEIVAVLNAAYRTPWGPVEKWRAKHADRPDFNAADIFLAEHEGRLAGCLHTAVRAIRFEGSVIRQSFDGDLGVDPKFRGAKIPERLYAVSSEVHYGNGVTLRGGFTQKELWERFYRPRIGYVAGFDGTRAFRKLLSADALARKIARALRAAPAAPGETGTVIEFRVSDLAPVHLLMTSGGFRTPAAGAPPAGPRLVIHVHQKAFGSAGGGRIARLAQILLSGAVRMSGALRKAPAFALAVLKARRGGGA